MKIQRLITFEGTEAQLRKQMENSLMDGTFRYMTTITVETVYTDVPELTGQNPKGWQPEVDSPLHQPTRLDLGL